MNTPTQEYGWLLIDTPEKKERFEPKLPTDEYWSEIRGNIWQVVGDGIGSSSFMSYTYRRKINPGEGWEIVPKDEEIPSDKSCEYLTSRDGNWYKWGNGSNQKDTVGDIILNNDDILAFRRRKSVVKESVTTGGWVSVKDSKPALGHSVWFEHETKGVCLCPDFKGFVTGWKQWRLANKSEIPQPPKDPADVAFDEWAKKHYGHMPMAGLSDAKCAWNARGEFERSKGQP